MTPLDDGQRRFLQDVYGWADEVGVQLTNEQVQQIWEATAEGGDTQAAAWDAFSQVAGLDIDNVEQEPDADQWKAIGLQAVETHVGRPLLDSERTLLDSGAHLGLNPLEIAANAGMRRPEDFTWQEQDAYTTQRMADLANAQQGETPEVFDTDNPVERDAYMVARLNGVEFEDVEEDE